MDDKIRYTEEKTQKNLIEQVRTRTIHEFNGLIGYFLYCAVLSAIAVIIDAITRTNFIERIPNLNSITIPISYALHVTSFV